MSESDVKSYIPVDFDPFGDAAAPAVHFPMTEAQREVWASVQMGAEASNAYNVCHAFRVRGAFSMDAMKTALQQLVDRHQALRLVCDPDGETQHELTSATIPVITVDLSAMTAAERERETSHYVDRKPIFLSILKKVRCAVQSFCVKTIRAFNHLHRASHCV